MSKVATRTAYGKALAELIVERDDVIVLDADLTKSTKTCDAKKARPEHHFNMGIAEGNMMGVAAGLAASGKVVYASSFAMFAAGRAYEQVRNSIAYPKLNVKVCATHAGITVGEDGASHQSVEDIALMRAMPNMKVFNPCDARQAEMIVKAVADIEGPCYVRLGRGNVEDVYSDDTAFTYGKGNVLRKGKKVAIVATGMMVQEALSAYETLKAEGKEVTVVDMPCIKPIDEELIKELAKEHEVIVSCEEHSVIGGLGSAIAEVLVKNEPVKMVMIGMQDCFGESGTPDALLEKYELNADSIVKKVENVWND
ncbi:transketolase family protein [Absiella sp. AM54-8XD]|uniref:transketolase family protein n=1 Tax=unclassified Amedibacterium TaxID=3088137 RepID=UPI000E410246|nr:MULTISPECIES: transketolase family protein [unclassified Absiella]RGC21482.1 transketolase family protein [Absiella sp. AM54-8XD]RGC44043.1 transketolase family protein [Absiella sp. AM29-15]